MIKMFDLSKNKGRMGHAYLLNHIPLMTIAALAKKFGITQKALKETAVLLGITIKTTTKTLESHDIKTLEKHFSQPTPAVTEKKKVEKKKTSKKLEPEIDASLEEEDFISEEPLSSTDAIIEEVEEDLEREIRKTQKKQKSTSHKTIVPEKKLILDQKPTDIEITSIKKEAINLPSVISVKEFSEKISVPITRVVAELMKNGLIVTINHKIDFDTASIIASSFGITVQQEHADFSSTDLMHGNIEKLLENEDASLAVSRPPIISIMGHVDHGKTKLLDYIRKTNVIDTEAGGITQKIGAYQVIYKNNPISFLDTPGHEAFTAMRARGAKATDIAVLVVAADEGVKPQTKEAYDHIKEANVPLIVALNKIDKPGANIDTVKAQLSEIGIIPEDWGGTTIIAPVSAVTGKGIEELLDMILLVSEMHQFKANPNRPAIGTVIESNLDPKLGPVATILINTGTLHMMDFVVVGETFGRVKVMYDHTFTKIKDAPPSMPVEIAGLSAVPSVGDILQVEQSIENARHKALEIETLRKAGKMKSMGTGMSDIIAKIHAGQLKTFKIVLKADSKGSLEAIRASIDNIKSSEVEAKVIHSNVGNITETDVLMAAASGGIVIGFSVTMNPQVERASLRENVEVRTYRVIYQLLEDIKKILLGLLDPEIKETVIGEATVLAIFLKDKKGMIVGTRITKGKAEQKIKVRVIRKDKLMGEGEIPTIRREKDNVPEIKEGYECGLRYDGSVDIETGDILEFYKLEKVKKETL